MCVVYVCVYQYIWPVASCCYPHSTPTFILVLFLLSAIKLIFWIYTQFILYATSVKLADWASQLHPRYGGCVPPYLWLAPGWPWDPIRRLSPVTPCCSVKSAFIGWGRHPPTQSWMSQIWHLFPEVLRTGVVIIIMIIIPVFSSFSASSYGGGGVATWRSISVLAPLLFLSLPFSLMLQDWFS